MMEEKRRELFKGKPVFYMIVAVLCLVSLIEVFSASSRMTFGSDNYLRPVIAHSIHMIFGLGAMWVISIIPCKYFKAFPYILVPLAAIMLLMLFVRGLAHSGAQRWIDLGFFSLQPSEVAKIAVLMTVSSMLAKLDVNDELSQIRTFWRIMAITAFFCLLIMLENLSTALLLALVVFIMMCIGQISRKYLLYLAGGVAGAGVIMLAVMLLVPPAKVAELPLPDRFPTWQARVRDFLGAEENLTAQEYVHSIAREKPQETHANIAIATSGILGKGPGNSTERDFLQEASCDFIYAIIIEELGVVGSMMILLIYLWLTIKIGGVAKRCAQRFPKYLAMSIGLMICIQALVNMAVAVGLIPVTGQPLPLISTGGTSILFTCIYMGMILSISWSGSSDDGSEMLQQGQDVDITTLI